MPTYSPISAAVSSSGPTIIVPTAREISIYGKAGLRGWWEADNGAGRSWCDDPGAVASFAWKDRKALTPLVPKLTQKPIIAAGVVNGRAALQFGHGGSLAQGSANGVLYNPTAALVGLTGYSFAMVYRLDTSQAGSTSNYVLGNQLGSGTNNGFGFVLNETGGSSIVYHQTNSGTEAQFNSTLPVGFVTDVLSYNYTTKVITLRRNGAQIGQKTGVLREINGAAGGQLLSVGGMGSVATATGAFSGEIASVIAFDVSVVDDATLLADLEGHLRAGWATW